MDFKDIKSAILDGKKILVITVLTITVLASIYCYVIATPYYQSQSSFYQKKQSSSLSGMNSSFGKIVEKQLGLGANDKSFNIYIPELIYESDKILDVIIKTKFTTSASKEAVTLSDFWGFNDIENLKERDFLLKEKLRKLINIKNKDESQLITMSIETEDKDLSPAIMRLLVAEISNFISRETRMHYKKLSDDIKIKEDEKLAEYTAAVTALEKHLIDNDASTSDDPKIQIAKMKLEDAANLAKELYLAQKLDFERAKNLEKDNTETLLIIKEASEPIKQSWPKNLLIIALSFISSLFGTTYLLVLRRKFG